jgi:Ca-activated chloride channel family protein
MVRKGTRSQEGYEFKRRITNALSWPLVFFLLLVTIFSGIFLSPTSKAGGLGLGFGNVRFTIEDHGVISGGITWPFPFRPQADIINNSYLTIYHDAYPSGGGNLDVASGYGFGTGDFTVVEQNAWVQWEAFQVIYSSFTQTGVSGVSNDLNIFQRAFSEDGGDWAIVMWKLVNIYGQDIYDLRVGMNFQTRIGNTPGDDIDHWNAADSIYYVEDGPTGSVLMGLASADPTFPVDRYYGNPSGLAGAVDPSDDQSLYDSLMTNKVHGSPDDMTCMVGWEVGTLPAGSNISLPLAIAFGTTYQDLTAVVDRAKEFLVTQKRWLMITEIQDFSSSDNAKIEIYNGWEKTFLTSDIYLSPDGLTSWTSGTWSKTTILPGEYSVYTLGPGEDFPSTEGASLALNIMDDSVSDSVSFGQLGPAPDPLIDESIARYWDGAKYSDEWVRDPTPTFGTHNDGLGKLQPPPVVLNEVYFNGGSSNDRFLEISYFGPGSFDVSGWTLVVDSPYILPPATMDISNRFFVLREDDFPADFDMDDGTLNGDNVYLYDELGRLVDMVGWSSAHTRGLSVARVVDVSRWRFDGFDDVSSIEVGWEFDISPTSEAVRLTPHQYEKVYVGEDVQYNISLGSFGSCADIFDITFISTLGWETNITDTLGNPILDHDGDSLPDGDLMLHGDALDMKVQVTVPIGSELWDFNVVYVTATSSVNANVSSTGVLKSIATLHPYIVVNKSAEPNTIWLEGSLVFPQETTLTLNVTGSGATPDWYVAQDVVFVIDNSGSMGWNDPQDLRLSAAKAYVDMMRTPDRAATVMFARSAVLVGRHHLTSDYNQVRADIDTSPPLLGGTDLTPALATANIELRDYGYSPHIRTQILLTDGLNVDGNDFETIEEAQVAANEGITIFTIGLGSEADEVLLRNIASTTGGRYYHAPTPEALEDIYLAIYRSLKPEGIAGKRIEDPVKPNPMIRDILPPYIHYIPGSFRDQNSTPRAPDVITLNPDGTTVLDWDVEKVFINRSWVVRFEVTSSLSGHVPVGVYPLSRVNYSDWDDTNETVSFPETFVNVMAPTPVNLPTLYISTDQNDVCLSWTIPQANISHYLIYRATDQREFNFMNPDFNTLTDPDNGVKPTRTSWNDTGAASSSVKEYYYVIRAVSNQGAMSATSNTVGKWTTSFDFGLNAFSLPLEPVVDSHIEWLANSIPNATYVNWLDDTGRWQRQLSGGPVSRTDPLRVGETFEIYLTSPTTYTSVGNPASMIRYREGLGDSLDFRTGLGVAVFQDDVSLYWITTPGAAGYRIYRSENRTGLHDSSLAPIVSFDGIRMFWKDIEALSQSDNWYYMVVPFYENGNEGSSTYSIGVSRMEYYPGVSSFALPVKQTEDHSLDWYCDNIPNVVGIVYMIFEMWKFHANEMPDGVYDVEVLQGEGYQISIDGSATRFVFIGY